MADDSLVYKFVVQQIFPTIQKSQKKHFDKVAKKKNFNLFDLDQILLPININKKNS